MAKKKGNSSPRGSGNKEVFIDPRLIGTLALYFGRLSEKAAVDGTIKISAFEAKCLQGRLNSIVIKTKAAAKRRQQDTSHFGFRAPDEC